MHEFFLTARSLYLLVIEQSGVNPRLCDKISTSGHGF
jgi:hypothetical protein